MSEKRKSGGFGQLKFGDDLSGPSGKKRRVSSGPKEDAASSVAQPVAGYANAVVSNQPNQDQQAGGYGGQDFGFDPQTGLPYNNPNYAPNPGYPVPMPPTTFYDPSAFPLPQMPGMQPPLFPNADFGQVDQFNPGYAAGVNAGFGAAPTLPYKRKDKEDKHFYRAAAGLTWEDRSLADWDQDDFRLFIGDLGNEVNDEILRAAFIKYPSLLKVKVIRDKKTQKSKGFGFLSFKDPSDGVRALKEMNGKYIGNRPVKLKKSTWEDREVQLKKPPKIKHLKKKKSR